MYRGSLGPAKSKSIIPEPVQKQPNPLPQPQPQPKFVDPPKEVFASQWDIPDEHVVAYNPSKYYVGNMSMPGSPQSYAPSTFRKVEKMYRMEGWVLLQSRLNPQEWKRQYAILFDKVFIVYYEQSLHLRVPKLCLNFDLQWYHVEPGAPKSCEFGIIEANKHHAFVFRAETSSEKDRWVANLTKHLDESCGVREKLFKMNRIPRFWKVAFF